MILGEKQNDVIDMTQVCEDHNGEMYQNPIHLIMSRPLGLGALIYAKLVRADIEGEVYWNHFEGSVTVVIPGRYQGVVRERDMPASRAQQLAIVEDFVKWVHLIETQL